MNLVVIERQGFVLSGSVSNSLILHLFRYKKNIVIHKKNVILLLLTREKLKGKDLDYFPY